jgi:hypothetical protein
MVVWLFAGGGESEVKGSVLFLKKHFSICDFSRKTPVRYKPAPKPKNVPSTYGLNKTSFIDEIKRQLNSAINAGDKCDLILVIDDLDCRDKIKLEEKFIETINSIQGSDGIKKFVGFASPELEAWIIADWDNAFDKFPDFSSRRDSMRYWLTNIKHINFNQPEVFSKYNIKNGSCEEKLSDAIIEASKQDDERHLIYKKGEHTSTMLMKIDPNVVKGKCPLFNNLYNFLNNYCSNNSNIINKGLT